ncbi:phosphodiester glycosidase family protein [Paenibacillus gansuensis]|uniref:Phosphodiester glycosidase family protein n=1 Tax=Paenibacillus gansuensis TaxID=306542 RepID=A0ABW5PEA7_9BACL
MSTNPTLQTTATHVRGKRKKRKSGNPFLRFVKWTFWTLLSLGIASSLFAAWFFLTPSGSEFRYLAADTLITTQHRVWAKYLIGEEGLSNRVKEYADIMDQMGEEKDTHVIETPAVAEPDVKPIEIKPISGDGYKGYMVFIKDPKSIRLVVPAKPGKGEKVSSMVKRTGALLGINAGGFADPNWKGNGFVPIGLVISNGEIFFNSSGREKPAQIVGMDQNGKMIAGKYTPKELLDMGIKEGVTFQPRLIVNGKGLVRNAADGWGIAPRTVMAQKADGTIIFVIIDGRKPAYSVGTNLYEIQNLLLDEGAVIAANLDGGSSTVLVEGEGMKDIPTEVSEGSSTLEYPHIVNRPSSEHGERYLPSAFLVFEHPDEVEVLNVWKNATKDDLDPSKW